MKRLLIAPLLALACSGAFASTCQKDLREIDKALANPGKASPANVAEARKLRAEGASLCHAGKQEEARGVLRRATRLLDLG